MKRAISKSIGLGAFALLVGSAAQGPESPTQPQPVQPTARTQQPTARTPKPAPVAPVARPTASREYTLRPRVPYFSPQYFVSTPRLRRVKYGKHRWVMLS